MRTASPAMGPAESTLPSLHATPPAARRSSFDASLREYTARKLTQQGVQLLKGVVKEVRRTEIELQVGGRRGGWLAAVMRSGGNNRGQGNAQMRLFRGASLCIKHDHAYVKKK